MLLQNARHAARVDAAGEIVTLEHQDRRLWDRTAIAEGLALVAEQAGDPEAGTYALQAAVAAHHARAATAADTDWSAIVTDYDRLLARHPSVIIEFNRAIAVGFADGPDAGLVALDALADRPELADHHLYPAARGDALLRAGLPDAAAAEFRAARALAPSDAERRLLDRRIAECETAR